MDGLHISHFQRPQPQGVFEKTGSNGYNGVEIFKKRKISPPEFKSIWAIGVPLFKISKIFSRLFEVDYLIILCNPWVDQFSLNILTGYNSCRRNLQLVRSHYSHYCLFANQLMHILIYENYEMIYINSRYNFP